MNSATFAVVERWLASDYLNATLLASLLSVLVLLALFQYLNRYTQRRYFSIWTVAWMFYGLWLILHFSWVYAPARPLWVMLSQFAVGTTAAFLIWGSATFINENCRQTMLGGFLIFLLAWAYTSAYFLPDSLFSRAPMFLLIGAASFANALYFLRVRRAQKWVGAGLLGMGFCLWGLQLALFPFFQETAFMMCAAFLGAAVIHLFIAVSMIVLVLEEVRVTNQTAIAELKTSKSQTERLRATIHSTEERYRSLFDQASEGIVIADAETLQLLELNQTAERLLGISRSEASQHSLCSFIGASPVPQNTTQWLGQYHGQLRIVRRDGSATLNEIDSAPVVFAGRPAFQLFFRELTEKYRLEQQLRQAEKLSALGRMISGVAHELNNPLAVMKGYLELILARHELADVTRADLQKVAHESSRAAKLVNNFLSFARAQPTSRSMVNLNDLVRQIVGLREMDWQRAGIEWSLNLTADLPLTAADSDQIEQLLINLTGNAVQALSHSPVKRLKISTAALMNRIQVRVEDSGPGVPDHLLPHIFEPFFTTKEVGTGTGLGLSVAHSIVSDHNGQIFYQPSCYNGAAFVAELPIVPMTESSLSSPPPGTAAPGAPAVAAPAVSARILVLDDEQSLGELLGQLLSLNGHIPTLCQAPLDALALIDTQDFDLILSDYRMPVMDGRQFFEAVKQRKPELARRIIFLTGDVVSEDTKLFLKTSGNPHLAKPFNVESVEKLVRQMLADSSPGERKVA